ncbi:hypothetical protein SUGI_0610090 [Cryptomeria japonica]|uniref:uncharacterized protein LOC131077314 n=1 Tax=Cryptomeria japonica TaxID=3369 RepID=UPI002414B70A|nr:uncharacterized protein LOC131077314 [Cryptomeria japonica]GLJ30766.1 hypothetical protein SUGI_0610090 [Cryptomeria japonica]
MGNAIARLFEQVFSCGPKEVRILMLGLDGAGKTTILYKFKLGEYVRTVPTIGFNIETVRFKNLSFTVWDVGGQDKIRHLWRQYMVNAQGLIFVLDSCDKERIKAAKQELDKLMSDPELADVKLLVLANKHDLSTAIPVSEATQMVGLNDLKQRKWHIQKCSGKTGEGLRDGLDWLANAIKEPNILQRVGSLRLPRSLSHSSSHRSYPGA